MQTQPRGGCQPPCPIKICRWLVHAYSPFYKQEGSEGRKASCNCFWDCYWGCANRISVIFSLSLEIVPKVLTKINSTQSLLLSKVWQICMTKAMNYLFGTLTYQNGKVHAVLYFSIFSSIRWFHGRTLCKL